MRPYIHSFSLVHKIVWVTDCSVGRGAQNSLPADVSYLQWYYVMAANRDSSTPSDRSTKTTPRVRSKRKSGMGT
jgi:hypothetical protein